MTTTEITVPLMTNASFGATEHRTCDTLRTYWRNGETHLALRDRLTGERFDSPAIFWKDIDDPMTIPGDNARES